jgi:hypothetical protein
VGHPAGLNGILQGLNDMILSQNLFKNLGAAFPG